MKQNAQYYADKAEDCLVQARALPKPEAIPGATASYHTLPWLKWDLEVQDVRSKRSALLAEAQVYATLAVAGSQGRGRT